LSGVTDASGKHRLHIDFDRVNPARPATLTASASVSDVNRQQWSSKTTILIHPANLYVGIKTDKVFTQLGQPLPVQAIVTDLDGKLIDNREIKMVATRLSWRQEKGDWKVVENDPQAYASGSLKLSIPPFDRRLSVSAMPRDKALEPGGETNVRVEVKDASGAPVSGGEVAVIVVDEAVLALTNYKLDDPVSVFYGDRPAEVEDVHMRAKVWLATGRVLESVDYNAGGGDMAGVSVYLR
jgi:hypothetical protein